MAVKGEVTYELRADDSKLESDLKEAQKKVEQSTEKTADKIEQTEEKTSKTVKKEKEDVTDHHKQQRTPMHYACLCIYAAMPSQLRRTVFGRRVWTNR